MATAAVDLDRFDDSDTRLCDRQCSSEAYHRLEMELEIQRNLNLSHRDDFADWLGTERTLHPGLECNLMDQYLVSLSSLLKRKRRKLENVRKTSHEGAEKFEFFHIFRYQFSTVNYEFLICQQTIIGMF